MVGTINISMTNNIYNNIRITRETTGDNGPYELYMIFTCSKPDFSRGDLRSPYSHSIECLTVSSIARKYFSFALLSGSMSKQDSLHQYVRM